VEYLALVLVGAAILAAAFWLRPSHSEVPDSERGVLQTPASPDYPELPDDADAAIRREWFWQIVELSREGDPAQEEQIAQLRAILSKYPAELIEVFGSEFDAVLSETYSWDLWGAAYVIMGGCSDDSFEYFRVWMVSRGNAFFEAARENPDRMAELIPPTFDDLPDFELFAYAAGDAWALKTGEEPYEMPTAPNMIYTREPDGQPFGEEDDDFSDRYPMLWERFGARPLGCDRVAKSGSLFEPPEAEGA